MSPEVRYDHNGRAIECGGHRWEVNGVWGVVIGLSRCERCGITSRAEHFQKESARG